MQNHSRQQDDAHTYHPINRGYAFTVTHQHARAGAKTQKPYTPGMGQINDKKMENTPPLNIRRGSPHSPGSSQLPVLLLQSSTLACIHMFKRQSR